MPRSRSRSRGKPKSRSGTKPSRAEVGNRTYRPPVVDTRERSVHSLTRRSEGGVPQNFYMPSAKHQPTSPESQLTDEGNDALRASRARNEARQIQRIQPGYHETADPTTAYRLAEGSYDGDIHPLSPKHRRSLNKWYQRRFPLMSQSRSLTDGSETVTRTDSNGSTKDTTAMSLEHDDTFRELSEAEDDYLKTKQQVAVLSILLTSSQLLVLMLQLTMCGMAPLDVNGFIGPYPSAFSEWGGKNAYLMLYNNQWWRLVTPSFLHVGVVHLLLNSFCQLEAIALFEREWGSFRWALVYLISSIGCNSFSSLFDQDTIAVGSSGALMGMFGAKLAQVITLSIFELKTVKYDDLVRIDQLSSTLCGMTIIFVLSAFSYIDWSGHMGGFMCGFFVGMVFFSNAVESCCSWFFWVTSGLLGLLATLAAIFYFFITEAEPIEDIADACEYFRSFFPEDYDCQCLWH